MIELGDFQPYIQSILDSSQKDGDWGDRYIPTQAELPLRVQTYESSSNELTQSPSEEKKQREQFAVLDGLRKYAPEQVLLLGKPGSGKSTALRRLRWEEAERCAQAIEQNQDTIPPIPVLLELRSLGDSVLELLRETLEWSGTDLEEKTLKALLREKKFLLLMDGINELPNDAAQKAVGKFRQLCASAKVPLIFTTRELGTGFDLGVSCKLEMLPLSEPQVREFVQKQLPEQGDVLLRQVQGRLRELAETPLLLKLLCEVFRHNQQQVPRSRGELFRRFVRDYDQIKPWDTVAASPGFREFRDELLRELAAAMMQGVQPTGLRLQISRDEAERILEKSLASRVEGAGQKAKEWLGDLIKHHVLQIAANHKQIEFHHQLFQEYYAGEWLFLQLKDLSNDELKYHYLNYLKWTESLAMIMAFVQSEHQAESLVKLALGMDWGLGSRLAGEVKSEFQATTVERVRQLQIPDWLKVELLGKTRSNNAVLYLEKSLNHKDSLLRWHVVNALWEIQSEPITKLLIHALNDTNYSVRSIAEDAVDNISSSQSVIVLRAILANHKQPLEVKEAATQLLMKPSSDDLFRFLKRIAEDQEQEFWLRRRAAFDLSKVDPESGLDLLHQMIKEAYDVPKEVLNIVGINLREIRSENSVAMLLEILNSYENLVVRCSAAITLASIGSQKAISPLLEILKIRSEKSELHSESSELCSNVAYALGGYASQELFEISLKILKKPWEDVDLRSESLNILCKKGDQEIIEEFKNIIFNDSEDQTLRIDAIQALRFLDDWIPNIAKRILGSQLSEDLILKHKVVNILQELDKDESIALLSDLLCSLENSGLKSHAASALHKYSNREDILSLLKKALKNSHQDVRQSAAKSLARPGNEDAVSNLLELLEGGDSSDRQSAICALASIGSEKAYAGLLSVFQDNDGDLSTKNLAIWALTQIDVCRTLELLTEHLKNIQDRDLLKEIIILLGKSSEPNAVEPLLQLLSKNSEDSMIQNYTLHALGQVATPSHISILINLPPIMSSGVIAAIAAIQSRCGFYNYDIAQSPLPEVSTEIQKGGNSYNFPNAKKVQIIEHIDKYNEDYNP